MSEFCPYIYKGNPVKLKYPWTFPMPSDNERNRRWQAIRKSMRNHNFDCLIVNAPVGYMPTLPNFMYYVSNYVPFANTGTYLVFPAEGEPQLEVNNDLGPQFQHIALETSWINDVVMNIRPVKEVLKKIKQLKLENGRIGLIGYRMGLFPASVYNALHESFPAAQLEEATHALHEAMNEVSRTSEEELMLLRRGCEILDQAYEATVNFLKPGITENELWAEIERVIIKNGGWYPHFILGASGPNPVFMRAPPSHHSLKTGDVILFEIDSIYGGIFPQVSWAFSLGRPKTEIERMFNFCEEFYPYALSELEKKRTFLDIELDLAKRIHEAGYEPVTPQIHRYNTSGRMPMDKLPQPGDYFTVHPNVTNPSFTAAAKFGDTVRIAETGQVQRMQKTPAKLNIVW